GEITQYAVSDMTVESDVWEGFAWVKRCWLGEDYVEEDPEMEEYCYAKLIVGGIDSGHAKVLFAEEAEEEDFNYKEFNWFRRVPGRCLPQSNTEVLIRLQVQMNELMNELMKCLRKGSLQLFQTTKSSIYRNLMQDAQDGDVLVAKDSIQPIALEMRAWSEFQTMFTNILNQADLLCNTPDVVTGDSMPTNTPFRLGAQLGVSANKIFDQVREDCGFTISDVFRDWILPEIIDQLSMEHVLEVMGGTDEMKVFDEKYRDYVVAQNVKQYILDTNSLPSMQQIDMMHKMIAEGMDGKTRKVKIEEKYFTMEKIKSMRLYFDITDERRDFVAERETMSTVLGIIGANPAITQSPEGRALLGRIMEFSNISPLILASLASQPIPKAAPQVMPDQSQTPPAEKVTLPETAKNMPTV
ncbi:MAG: hypothetical protein WC477_07680, partial [Patescibacteria group bacterium]